MAAGLPGKPPGSQNQSMFRPSTTRVIIKPLCQPKPGLLMQNTCDKVESFENPDTEQLEQSIFSTETQIVDARSAARFHGNVDEPRAGVRRGHIPGSYNLPFQSVLENGKFKEVSALEALFAETQISLDKPIICSCGSGVTACIIGVAALLCGATDVRVYDGAWSEWGANSHFPVEV